MRGEDGNDRIQFTANDGSPPHAWGRPRPAIRQPGLWRFTPTCVGKTGHNRRPERPWSVHPHMRGEDERGDNVKDDKYGSPPHAWGRRPRSFPPCGPRAVHPHMRGEDLTKQTQPRAAIGSPPHAWGRRGRGGLGRLCGRFTPTCVGKTLTGGCPPRHRAVHPHMRGEDVHNVFELSVVHGSPPHAWGRLFTGSGHQTWGTVHPHMRGEDAHITAWGRDRLGSPPHAWGRLFTGSGHQTWGTVHPHMRGEDGRPA